MESHWESVVQFAPSGSRSDWRSSDGWNAATDAETKPDTESRVTMSRVGGSIFLESFLRRSGGKRADLALLK